MPFDLKTYIGIARNNSNYAGSRHFTITLILLLFMPQLPFGQGHIVALLANLHNPPGHAGMGLA